MNSPERPNTDTGLLITGEVFRVMPPDQKAILIQEIRALVGECAISSVEIFRRSNKLERHQDQPIRFTIDPAITLARQSSLIVDEMIEKTNSTTIIPPLTKRALTTVLLADKRVDEESEQRKYITEMLGYIYTDNQLSEIIFRDPQAIIDNPSRFSQYIPRLGRASARAIASFLEIAQFYGEDQTE